MKRYSGKKEPVTSTSIIWDQMDDNDDDDDDNNNRLRKNGVVYLTACIDEINLAFLICILHKASSCLVWL